MPLRTLPAAAPVGPAGARRRARVLSPLLTLAVAATLAAPAVAGADAIGWSPTVDIASPLDGAANLPDVAVDSDGTAYAAFVRASSSGGPALVQVASRPRGGAWSIPVTVSRAVGSETGSKVTVQPQIAVRDGAVAVGWLQTAPDSTRSATHEAWAAVRTAEGRWNAPRSLSTVPEAGAAAAPASDLAIAVRPGGTATVAFFDADDTELVTREGAPDGTWTAAVGVSPGSASIYAGYTDLAVAEDGAETLVWQDAPGDSPAIAVAERPAGATTWSSPVALSDLTDYSLFPKVVVAENGDADVVWPSRVDEDSEFANYEVQLAHREGPTGTWTDPEILSPPGGDANGRGTSKAPALAVAPDGDLTVAWLRAQGANADLIPDRIQVRTRTAAGTWDDVKDVWSGLRNPTLRAVTVAAGRGGQATVAVSGYTTSVGAAAGPRNVRVVRRETLGGAWSAQRELSVARAGSSTAVSWEIPMAADPRGNVTLAWHQIDSTGETGVQSAFYRAAEEPTAPEPDPTPTETAPAATPTPVAPAPAAPVTPTPTTAPLRLGVGWYFTQARGYAAREGLLVAFRGTPGAKADLVVRRGGKVVARVRGARIGKDGRLVRRIRLAAATRRSLLASKRTVTLRVTATVAGRSKHATVRLR
jgi:hypothetical protein